MQVYVLAKHEESVMKIVKGIPRDIKTDGRLSWAVVSQGDVKSEKNKYRTPSTEAMGWREQEGEVFFDK